MRNEQRVSGSGQTLRKKNTYNREMCVRQKIYWIKICGILTHVFWESFPYTAQVLKPVQKYKYTLFISITARGLETVEGPKIQIDMQGIYSQGGNIC